MARIADPEKRRAAGRARGRERKLGPDPGRLAAADRDGRRLRGG
jgi:hypothetical protein